MVKLRNNDTQLTVCQQCTHKVSELEIAIRFEDETPHAYSRRCSRSKPVDVGSAEP